MSKKEKYETPVFKIIIVKDDIITYSVNEAESLLGPEAPLE